MNMLETRANSSTFELLRYATPRYQMGFFRMGFAENLVFDALGPRILKNSISSERSDSCGYNSKSFTILQSWKLYNHAIAK